MRNVLLYFVIISLKIAFSVWFHLVRSLEIPLTFAPVHRRKATVQPIDGDLEKVRVMDNIYLQKSKKVMEKQSFFLFGFLFEW